MTKYLMTFFLILSFMSFAEDGKITIVAIGDAEQEKDKMHIQKFQVPTGLTADEIKAINELEELFFSDFNFYRHLFDVTNSTENKLEDLQKEMYRFVITSKVRVENKKIFLSVSLNDLQDNQVIHSFDEQVWLNNIRKFGHQKANNLYKAITGKESVFNSKIVFVSDRTSVGKKQYKELYIMDFDGERKQRITYKNSLIMAPAISPDNSTLLFTAIESRWRKGKDGRPHKIRNLNLYTYDMNSRKQSVVSALDGINSGAVFTEDGKSIYLTLSFQKNADIFKMDLKSKRKTRITKHFLDDVDPHINADGTLMTFLSGRSGKAMIYTCDPRGVEKSVKRISYVGRFNAAPRFSPDGKEIVFSSWVDNRFDLYKIGSDGNNLVRLTKDFGSNEEAWFSPDGQFIVFTSQRVISAKKAVQNIYIMNREGEIIKQLTEKFGKVYTPRWSK
jgi:TolB protein